MGHKIAVVTDSNSGITQEQARKLGVYVLPTPFLIDGNLYLEDVSLTREVFFEKLTEEAEVSTSQPSPGDILELWDDLLEEYDEIIHIPLSKGLSNSYQTSVMLSQEYDGKVFIVDSQRISVTQKAFVEDALYFIQQGKSASEIKDILEKERLEASIYITVDTLKYLKKGGRITPAAATIGSVLNIKPVLQIQGDKLDSFAKVRGWKSAKNVMLDALEKDLQERFAGEEICLYVATTCNEDETDGWKKEVQERFPGYPVEAAYLSLSVSCHIGPGALGIGCAKRMK